MRTSIFLAASALLLVSCARPSTADPAEVLRLTALANQELLSGSFDLDAEFNMETAQLGGRSEGVVNAMGSMQNGGRQLSMDFRTNGTLTTTEGNTAWNVDAELIVAGEKESYLKINTLSFDPPTEIFSMFGLDQAKDAWLLLPSGGVPAAPASVTPDPKFLRMQAEVVTVTNDNGIVSLDGHDVHHYDVAVDKAKLAAFLEETQKDNATASSPDLENLEMTGELWIDSESYVIRRVRWNIVSADGAKPVRIVLTLNIGQHNEPVEIVPPAEFREFTLPGIQGLPSGFTLPSAE